MESERFLWRVENIFSISASIVSKFTFEPLKRPEMFISLMSFSTVFEGRLIALIRLLTAFARTMSLFPIRSFPPIDIVMSAASLMDVVFEITLSMPELLSPLTALFSQ